MAKTGRPPTGNKYPNKINIYLTDEQKQFLEDNFETVTGGIRSLVDEAMTKGVSDTAKNAAEFDPWVPLAEAATIIGISPSNLRRYCAMGLWGEKMGRNWFMRKSEVFDVKKMFDRNEFDENGLYTG